MIKVREIIEVVVERPETMLMEKIKRARGKNEEVVRVIEEMKKVGVRNLRDDEWEIKGELVLKEEKVYVPKNEELRIEVIWLYHDIPVAGYGGSIDRGIGKNS